MKKISVKKKVQLKLQIDLPENLHTNPVFVYLMADSYVGLDQIQKVNFKIKEEWWLGMFRYLLIFVDFKAKLINIICFSNFWKIRTFEKWQFSRKNVLNIRFSSKNPHFSLFCSLRL